MSRFAVFAALASLLVGCALFAENESEALNYPIVATYRAADALIGMARPQLDPEKPIIIATVVDIDNLEGSSTLGRFISESVSARFTQARYRMVEMKLQNAVYMKRDEGELMLTRQIRELAGAHQAQAVVVGTYSSGASAIFVNLKVVQPQTNVVLAAYDYSLRMTRNVCTMANRDLRRCDPRG